MAAVPQIFVSRTPRRSKRLQPLALMAVISMTLPLAGCFTTLLPWHAKKADISVDPIALLTVQWKQHVLFAPDPVHNGQPIPALAARIYFFGSDVSYPVKANGDINVKLYLPSPQPGQPGKLLEEWNIDHATLEGKLARKDMVGWGYTLLLPWSTYNPSIRDIELVTCYKPKSGPPIYKRSRVRLRDAAPQLQIQHRVETAPGAGQPQTPAVPLPQPNSPIPQPGGPRTSPATPPLLPPPTPLPPSSRTPPPGSGSAPTGRPQGPGLPPTPASQPAPATSPQSAASSPRLSTPVPAQSDNSQYPRTLRLRVENGRFLRQQ